MTPQEYLISEGYDPTQYTIDAEGYPIPLPPKKRIGPVAAFGAGAARSVLPTLAALKAGAAAGALGGSWGGPIGAGAGAILGGLTAGFGANKLQDVALDAVDPSINQFVAESREQNPIAGYAGEFIPNVLALRPDVKGVKALSGALGLMGQRSSPAGTAALINVGANVAGSGAGQLVKMSQGGDFSLGEFAADTALGTLFNRPSKFGERLGLAADPHYSDLNTKSDLTDARAKAVADYVAKQPSDPTSRPVDLSAPPIDDFGDLSGPSYVPDPKAYVKDWYKSTEPTVDLIRNIAKEHKLKIGKERMAEIANEPYVSEILAGDYTNWPEFIAKQSELALEAELNNPQFAAFRGAEEMQKPWYGVEERFEDLPPRYPVMSAEEAAQAAEVKSVRETKLAEIRARREAELVANRQRQAELEREMLGVQMGAERERLANLRSVLQGDAQRFVGLQDKALRQQERAGRTKPAEGQIPTKAVGDDWLAPTPDDIAAVDLNAEELARLQSIEDAKAAKELNAEIPALIKAKEAELADVEAGDIYQHFAKKNAVMRELEDLRKTRFQREIDETPGTLTQEELDAFTTVLNRRGVNVRLEDIDGNGRWAQDANGTVEVVINPRTARLDTIIEELGHDVFQRSATNRMQKSLMQAIEESPRYREELRARLAEGMDARQAEDIAREEGLMDVFRRQTGVDNAELTSWWKAFKASMKSLVGSKLSPEDAMAWLHYATHENVPWNTKGGSLGTASVREQGQRYFKELEDAKQRRLNVDDVDWDSLKANKPVTIDDIFGMTAPMSRMHVEKPRLIGHSDIELLGVEPRAGLMARDGAFGRAITTGSKNEGTILIDSNLWRNAIAGDPASRELFLKVLKHEMGHVDDGANVADRTQAEQERVANEFEARYQRRDPLSSNIDAVRATSPLHAKVADSIKAQYETRDYTEAQLKNIYEQKFMETSPELLQRVQAKRYAQMDSGVPATFTAEERVANDLAAKFLSDVPSLYNANGFKIKTDPNTYRDRKSWDLYTPAHLKNDEIEDIFRNPARMDERAARQAEFLNFTRDWYVKQGYTPEEAKGKAQEQLQREIGVMSGQGAAPDAASFAGSRRPLGPPLPPSWRSMDMLANFNNYAKRTALDFAAQKHVESDPVVMAALGAKTFTNGAPIPQAILDSTPPIHNESAIQALMRDANGLPTQLTNPTMMGLSRVVSMAGLQHISKMKDLTSTMFGGLKFLQPSDYAAGAANFGALLSDWSATAARSYANGLNKRDGAQQMRAVIGINEYVGDWMTKAAEKIAKVTKLNDLEQAARVIAQASGETFIKIAKTAALNGNVEYARTLDKLSPDWRSRPDGDLVAQFGRLLQGTYDARSVPAWALEGPAAPFMVWNRWSLGQYNNFKKFALEPALQGDVRPLMGHLLIGVLGGSAVEAVSEWMNQRDGRDVNWTELESWLQEHAADKNAYELIAQKMMATMQNVGTFGFVGDLAKMMTDGVATGTVQLPVTMPLASAAQDATKRTGAVLQALDAGEDFGKVFKQAMLDQAYSTVQMARVARNVIDEDSTQEYEDKRKMRVFNKLSGEPSSGNTFAQSYANVGEREYDRAKETEDLPGMASDLIANAAENATDQADFQNRLRKLTTSPRGILPTKPTKAAEYLKWLGTMDPAEAVDVKSRDTANKKLDAYKDRLIRQGAAGVLVGH